MSDESMMILNMLREGKITAEQADSLLRAVRESSQPEPAHPTTADSPSLAAIQGKLADMQNKLAELQGKQIAENVVRTTGVAASIAGKVFEHLPKPDIDLRKVLDDTMSGLSSIKNEVVRTAKKSAREAVQEAKRIAKESKNAIRTDNGYPFTNTGAYDKRPTSAEGDATVKETYDTTIDMIGAASLVIVNKYGNIKIEGKPDDNPGQPRVVKASALKAAWSGSESEAKVLLQQVFITGRVENGKCRVEVVAPVDADGKVTVDCTLTIPTDVPCEVEATFGDIEATGISPAFKAKSISGSIKAAQSTADRIGDTNINSQSGNIDVANWTTGAAEFKVETINGELNLRNIATGIDSVLKSRSGDIDVNGFNGSGALTMETISGDIEIKGASLSTQTNLKSQSGDILASTLRAGQIYTETVSGDVVVKDAGGALTVKTVSGDINADAVNSYSTALNTVSGDVSFAFSAPINGSFAGTTVSGDLHLAVWPNSDTRVEVITTSGDIDCRLQLDEKISHNERHLSGKIGSGAGSIRLQSISGDLQIKSVH